MKIIFKKLTVEEMAQKNIKSYLYLNPFAIIMTFFGGIAFVIL